MRTCATGLILFLLGQGLHGQAAVWIEGEQPDHLPAALKSAEGESPMEGSGYAFGGWGRKELISGERMLHLSWTPQQIDRFLPDEGLIFGYDVPIEQAGRYHVWARIGWEWARSDFDWRLAGGEWLTCLSSAPTVNIQSTQAWNELAWIELGAMDLEPGIHRLEFRHRRLQAPDRQGNDVTQRILHGLDAVYITADTFQPAGKYRPGQDHREAQDHEAAAHVFAVTVPDGAERAETRLDGLWEFAPWEETEWPIVDPDRLATVREIPENLDALRWWAYTAPSCRNESLPQHGFVHRYLLRARLDVPAELDGKGFFLDVQRSSMFVSAFVNGVYCGSTKAFHTAWKLDLTPGIMPGQVNELVLAFKTGHYAFRPDPGNAISAVVGNRWFWNLPHAFLNRHARLDVPIASDSRTGILEPATLVVVGGIYADDVFVKPSVQRRELGLDVTLRNPGRTPVSAEVRNRVIPWNGGEGGAVECAFEPVTVRLEAGAVETLDLTRAWTEPRLWWPDDPNLYWVVTDTVVDGRVVDTKRTRFGFREWTWNPDHLFRLNGVKWQLWADTNYGSTPREFVERSRVSGQNQVRYWRSGGWGDMTRREALQHFDETGMIVRSSGTFDGQLANYYGGLREPVPGSEPDARGHRPQRANQLLFQHWYEQMEAWVKAERNHPSIYIWNIENEITYINSQNLGQWREVEPAIRAGSEHVMRVDPTRPTVLGGGNALRDESMPVNGAHYTEFYNADFRDFPDIAYERDHWYDPERPQRGAWRMAPDRPILKSEVFFANGYTTDRLATIGGERCFIGMGETMEARGLFARMLSEGWRWGEVASWHFWMGESDGRYYNVWQPVVVLSRQWNWTWGSNETVERTLRLFNGTRHEDPITVGIEVLFDGESHFAEDRVFAVPAGEAETFTVTLPMPVSDRRREGLFRLTASRGGDEIWRDEKPIALLAPAHGPKPGLPADQLVVIDPQGDTAAYLRAAEIPFTPVEWGAGVPDAARVVVVGHDAIPAGADTETTWFALAARGKRVLVLDQEHPLQFRAIPADLVATRHVGRFGFSENLEHPAFKGLTQADFFTWGNDHILYRNVYRKGTRGGRSLFQCDNSLGFTALFESPIEDGLLVLSQLAVGGKLSREAVAQTMLRNLLAYCADFEPVRREARVVLPDGDPRAALLESVALSHQSAADPLATLVDNQVAVVDASPANLAVLADARDRVEAFCRSGGWLMLWGLGPDGLEAFNRLVGHNHVLRPFEPERVLLETPLDPIASGLTLRDVVMDTGERMYGWMALMRPDTEAFTYLVDHLDIAPFATFPSPTELGKPSDDSPGIDHFPRNMVNGFTSDDNWAFTYTIMMERGDALRFTLELPKEEEITALRIRPSKIYHPITKMNIYFDDDPEPVTAEIPVRDQPVVEDIPIAGRRARRVTLEVAGWEERGTANIVVIDNLWLQVRRDGDYMRSVRSILNIGGLMVYRIGDGGIVLNQLRIIERERNPINADKKAAIVRTMLGNAGAVFVGGRMIVAGGNVTYHPLRIPDADFNAYADRRGQPEWFRGPGDLGAIPVGEQRFGDVDFYLSDFHTSPVPSVFMLGSQANKVEEQEITGIAVDRQADALFFLHTAHPERDTLDWQRAYDDPGRRNRAGPRPVLFKYVVRYADDTTDEIPVLWGEDIGAWAVAHPQALPRAGLAWVGDLPDAEQQAAVYLMQWTNPKPGVPIQAIDIVGQDNGKWGAPAVFAITAASVAE